MSTFDPETRRPAGEASPVQALAFLWRGRWLIGAVTLLAAAGGVYYAEHRGTIWRARSVLYVERESPMMPGKDVSLWLQSRNYANTQAALLRSTPILQTGIAAVGDSDLFGDSDNYLAWLQRRLRISVGEQDDLITVTLDSPLVDEACRLVNAIVDAYLDFHARSQRDTASAVLTDLTKELDRYEQELQNVQKEQIEFLRDNPGVGPSQDWRLLAGDRIRELNNALTRAELEVIEAEAEWKTCKSMSESAELLRQLPLERAGAMPANPTDAELRRLQDLRLRLLTEVTPEHPEVRRIETMIQSLVANGHRVDEQFADGYLTLLEHRLTGAREKVADLRMQVQKQEQRALLVSPAQAEYRAIEARYERARKIADLLYDRVRSLDINERLDAARKVELNTLVYERAAASSAAVASSKRSLAAIATFLGLLLGTCLAWLRSLLDQRLRTPQDVAAIVPLLSTMPRLGRVQDLGQAWRRHPEFAAAMRSLRTVLHYGARGERDRILQVTSPTRHPTDSAIVAGLGMAMAQAGDRTLIIDANLGRGDQTRLLDVPAADAGLAQVLAGQLTASDAIVPTVVPNLRLLPAGTARRDLGGLLGDAALSKLLAEVADDHDRILICSPSLLDDPDARIIAAVSDQTLLVVRAGRTTRQALHAATGVIASVAGHLAGALLDGSTEEASLGVGGDAPAVRRPPRREHRGPLHPELGEPQLPRPARLQ